MNIELSDQNGLLVAKVLDRRLDAAAAPDLKAKVGDRIDKGAGRIVLDLTEVEFVDSTGLGAILWVLKRLPGQSLALAGCRPSIVELLKLTRLDRVFKLYPTPAEATAALGG